MTGLGFEDYPWVYPQPGFVPFNRAGTASIPALTSLQAPVTVATLPVSIPGEGWLNQLGITIAQPAVVWSLLVNGQGIPDYTAINTSLGSPVTPVPTLLRLAAGQTVTLVFANPGGIISAVAWRLFGWYNRPK